MHLLTDAFVDLRPGTSPGDHLVSGLVPVAVLVALAGLFPLARAGAGATMALVLGAAAAPIGAANVAATAADGEVGIGRTTGVVAGLAGVGLVGLAVTMLHRSRRTGARPAVRWLRRAGKGLMALVLLAVVSAQIAFGYVSANWSIGFGLDEAPLGPEYLPVTIETADGLSLVAAYRPSDNGAAIIVFPGRLPEHTAMLAGHGYGVLVLEPRGRSRSEGDPNLLGWTGEEDLRAALDYLQSRTDVDDGRIGGLGISVGGELLLQTAARDPALRAVVSEGAGTRTMSEELAGPVPWSELPAAAVAVGAAAMADLATAVFSGSLPPSGIHHLIGDIAPRPILLIWTGNGAGGEHRNPLYHRRARDPKQIWEIPESGHGGGIAARPDEYERRVVGFFNRTLLGPATER